MKRNIAVAIFLIVIASLAVGAALPALRQQFSWSSFTAGTQPQTKQTRTQTPSNRRVRQPLENFDIRANLNRSLEAPPTEIANTQPTNKIESVAPKAGQAKILVEHPNTNIRWSSLTGTPSRLTNLTEALSHPNQDEPENIGRKFFNDNRDLFQLSGDETKELKISRHDLSRHNGITHLTYEQNVGGINIFQGAMTVHLDRRGAVIAAAGELIPQAGNRVNLARPKILATEAFQQAATFADVNLTDIPRPGLEAQTPNLTTKFAAVPGFDRAVEAKLIYFPLSSKLLRLAWEFTLWRQDSPDVYLVLVDAERGSLLFRHNYTTYENPHGLVYTEDNPRPDLPHVNNDPPTVPQQDIPFRPAPFNGVTIFNAADKHYDWWAGASQTTLISNNVDAHLDRVADNIPDEPRLTVPDSNFSFLFDFTKPPTDADNQKAAQVNLFYWVNRYHDILYQYGFTETSGNFQSDNFGLGGFGNDRVVADVQDGGGVNNANFATPPDGSAGRVQMYLWNSGTPQQLDGDLDQGVILHELTHGLSNRLVGNGSGLSGNQSAGMGEGWSDYLGIILLRKESDNLGGDYAVGQYVRNNYPKGIRHYPYSTDKNVNPLTFSNIALNTEVHAVGEIWCNTLLEMRVGLIKKYGFAEGQRQSIQLIVDGLKLTPNAPGFIDARDAILLADRVNNNGANQCVLWQAFAKRGLGLNASSLGADDGAPKESFDAPAYCNDAGTISLDKRSYLVGENIRFTVGDRNAGNPTQITFTSSVTGDQEIISLASEAAFPGNFKGQIKLVAGKAIPGDGSLQASVESGEQITATYQDQNTGAGAIAEIKINAAVTREKIIFQDNVESGNQGWIPTGSWGIVTTKAASQTHSWTDSPTGNYIANSNTSLTSQVFNFSNVSDVTLQFAHSYDIEANYDFGLVEYTIDDGKTWQRAAAFSGLSTFNQAIIPLNALSNQAQARIRFRLLTDPVENHDGWYLDDVRISARSSNPVIIKPADQPTPNITAISPAFGALAGGTNVTISGANFTDTADTSVTFDGIAASSINVISGSTLLATTPAHAAGAVIVRVKNRFGETAQGNGFTYYQTGSPTVIPILSQVFPAAGSTRGGSVITISGANFTPETTIKFGTTQAIVTFINSRTLRVLTPVVGAAGAVDVTAANGAQIATLTNAFTFTAPTPPTVQVLTPGAGQNGFSGGVLGITWISADNQTVAKHKVSLFRDTTFVSDLADGIPGEAQSYNWRIPTALTAATNYRVRVVATDNESAETEAFSNTFTLARMWQIRASMPSALMRATYVSDGDNIIAIGGRLSPSSLTATDTVRRYDPNANLWTSLASLPVVLNSTDAAVINGKIYVPGGVTETSTIDTHYVYDLRNNIWTTAANTPLALSAYACATDAAQGIFYVTGGLNSSTTQVANVRAFDVAANTWSSLLPMNTARYSHKSAFIDGRLYVAGGFGIAGGLANCEVYDFATQKWTNIAPLNRARAFAASAVFKDASGNTYWLLVGGEDASLRTTLGTAELYDVKNNRWIALDDSFNLTSTRTQTNGVVAGNYFYVIGGGTGTTTQPVASSFNERLQLPLNLSALGAPPSLAVPVNQLAVAGNELKFTVTANELNALAPLTLTASDLPAGASFNQEISTINNARGVLRWTPTAADAGRTFTLKFQASDGGLSDTKNVLVNVVTAAPLAIVNAAHYQGGALPADSIASAFGANLAIRTEAALTLPVPKELAGTKVMVNGIPAPLLYVSPTQINFVMPSGLDLGTATIIVSNPTGKYALATAQITEAAPSIFTVDATGRGDAAALATADSINYLPAPFDVTVNGKPNFLILFGTGFRHATAANTNDENGVAESLRVTIDGQEARVLYAGAQGFYAGLDQINIELPATVQSGARKVEVVLMLNGIEANRVTIPLK